MPVQIGTSRPALSRRMSLKVDGLVAVFSEKARLNRIHSRIMGDLAEHRARSLFSYDGANKSHRHKNWISGGGSADADLDEDTLATLRERSRERMQNSGLANTIISSIQENVVGHGLTPKLDLDAKRLGISESHASELHDQAEDLWEEFAPHADSTNRLHMADIQALILASVLVNGDAFAMPIQVEQGRAPAPLGVKLELIEADRIDTPFGMTQSNEDSVIRNGVSLGKHGQPLAYWVAQQHPGENSVLGQRTFRRIKAHNQDGTKRMFHLFWQKRIGQTRGEPLFAPVLADFKDLGDWKEAELVAAQVASCFAVFITKQNPFESAIAAAGPRGDGKREQEVVPGQIYYGESGENVTSVTPGRPNALFEGFYTAVARQISSHAGIPLEVAMRDFHNTTYSQARAALLEARRMFGSRQVWMTRYILQPFWAERVLYEGWLRGRFDAGDFMERRHMWTRTNWQTPGWGHIDEEKSMKAAEIGLRLGVTTRQQITSASSGHDWASVNRQLAWEDEQMKKVRGIKTPEEQAEAEQAAAAEAAEAAEEEVETEDGDESPENDSEAEEADDDDEEE